MGVEIVLVTGAASGIGLAIAQALAGPDRRLFLLDVAEKPLAEAAAGIPEAVPLLCDLRDAAAIRSSFDQVRRQAGRLDLLVNNAGVAFPDSVEIENPEVWDEILEVNLLGVWLCARAALPLMGEGAMMIHISSTAARSPMKFQAAYGAAKAGVEAFSRALREELRPRGIRVGVVAPGPTKTGILRNFPRDFVERHRIGEEARMEAGDVARAVAFMASQPAHVSLDEVRITPAAWEVAP